MCFTEETLELQFTVPKLGSRGNNVSRLQKIHRKEHRQVKDSSFSEKGDNFSDKR